MFYLTKETLSFFIEIYFSDLDFLLYKKIRLVNTRLRRSFAFSVPFRTWQISRKRKIIQTELINCRWCIQKVIYEDCDLNYFDSNLSLRPRSSFWFRGELPIMAGEGPHDRVTFCRPQVYERAGKGNLSFRFGKRPKRPNRCILWLWKNRKNVLSLWLIHISKTLRLQQFEGMQSYNLGMWKGYRSSIEGRRKGYLSCQKWYIKE